MVRFRRLRGSQPESNFFWNTINLKPLQNQKGARLEAKKQFLHARFQNLSQRFWAFSKKAKLLKDISRVESRKIWKSRFGKFEIVFGFVFGKFTQKKVFRKNRPEILNQGVPGRNFWRVDDFRHNLSTRYKLRSGTLVEDFWSVFVSPAWFIPFDTKPPLAKFLCRKFVSRNRPEILDQGVPDRNFWQVDDFRRNLSTRQKFRSGTLWSKISGLFLLKNFLPKNFVSGGLVSKGMFFLTSPLGSQFYIFWQKNTEVLEKSILWL